MRASGLGARLDSRFPGPLVATLVFALLVAATVAAFFVTTRLKRSAPVVQQLKFARYLSPNGDGRHDTVLIGFKIKRDDEVTVSIVDDDGDEVRALVRDRPVDRGRSRFRWDGRLAGGGVAADGRYRVRVGLRRQGRTVTSRRKLFVDTDPPNPVVRSVAPDSISPDGAGSGNLARVRFDGPKRTAPRLLVYRTDAARPGGKPRLVARRPGRAGSSQLIWDGMVDPHPGSRARSRPAAPGNYALVVQARDAAGNVGPAGLPPTRGHLAGNPGLRVSYLSALGPPGPVRAGARMSFGVDSDARRYRWSVRRLGSSQILARGSSRARTLHLRAPRGRSGIFLLGLRVGSHRYRTPFAVQARRHERVLVVLPAITWQARNPADFDSDGFADTLPEQRSADLGRPFAGSGLPVGLTAREAPLLLFLDRNRLRYDLTTDLALVAGRGRPPIRYGGLLFASSPRFYPRSMATLMRSYVEAGGRIGWVGSGGFREAVRLERDRLERVGSGARRSENVFGEQLAPAVSRGPLTVLTDGLEFFSGVGGSFGPFPGLEETTRLPRGARLLASAGLDANRPALAVYRPDQSRPVGVVARVGVDGFARAAIRSPDVARIMRRLWTLLSR